MVLYEANSDFGAEEDSSPTEEEVGQEDIDWGTPPNTSPKTKKRNPRSSGLSVLDNYFDDIARRHPLMSREEEYKTARAYRETGDKGDKEKLVTSNLRFVVKIALQYKKYGFPIRDLIQEGNLGLVKAADKFDPEKGNRFITYAVWWIRAYIQNYIMANWSLVKLGTTAEQRAMFHALASGKGLENDPAKLAEKCGGTEEVAKAFIKRRSNGDVSIDAPEGRIQHGLIADETAVAPEITYGIEARQALIREVIGKALKGLPRREAYIIRKRWLVDKPVTLQVLGDEFGISKERIRQLEKRALEEMRESLPAEIAEYLE